MSDSLYVFSLCILFGTIIFIFVVRYVSLAYQARARFAQDQAYRTLAQNAASTQAETATALSVIQSALVDTKSRLAAIEKILKDVG